MKPCIIKGAVSPGGGAGASVTHVAVPTASGFHVLTIINNTGFNIDPAVTQGYAEFTPDGEAPFQRNVPFIANAASGQVSTDPATYSPSGITSIFVDVYIDDGVPTSKSGFATQTGSFTWSITFNP